MELYIEKEFLDNFYLDFSDKPIQKIVEKIFIEYGEKRVFINYKETDFEKLESENKYFALISNTLPPIPITTIKEHLFSKSDFNQTIVFTNNKEDWFEEAGSKGALCFSFDNYQKKIQNIVEKLHFKIDLSEPLLEWSFLDVIQVINFNKITITDGYVLTDKSGQKIEKNIIPILRKLISNNNSKLDICFFTKDLNPIKNEPRSIKEKATKRIRKLNSIFANYKVNFKIINSSINEVDIDLHDRYIATNFSLLDSGKGFNLFQNKPSNSQVISETIFDKYTYKRLNNIRKKQIQYTAKLKSLETSKFKMFP